MPDLPGSSFEEDLNMFQKLFSIISKENLSKNHIKYVLKYPDLQVDQLKIYPPFENPRVGDEQHLLHATLSIWSPKSSAFPNESISTYSIVL